MSGIFGAAADVDYESEMSMNEGRWAPTISEEAAAQQWNIQPVAIQSAAPVATMPPPVPMPMPNAGGPRPLGPRLPTVEKPSPVEMLASIAKPAVAMAAIVHGYKRNNDSIGWALGWGALGYLFWWATGPIMVAQGFAKPAQK